jgi:hypothetical protein
VLPHGWFDFAFSVPDRKSPFFGAGIGARSAGVATVWVARNGFDEIFIATNYAF